MKEALNIEELKALCEAFFNAGMRWQRRILVSPGVWEDRGELRAENFDTFFNKLMTGDYDHLINKQNDNGKV